MYLSGATLKSSPESLEFEVQSNDGHILIMRADSAKTRDHWIDTIKRLLLEQAKRAETVQVLSETQILYDFKDEVIYTLTFLLFYSLTHSLTYLLTYSRTHSLTHSLTYSLTHLLTYLLTHSCLLTHSYSLLLTSSRWKEVQRRVPLQPQPVLHQRFEPPQYRETP